MDRTKVLNYLNFVQQKYLDLVGDEGSFKLAICYVQLGEFTEAQHQFQRSCSAMFGSRSLWKNTSQVNWLADIYILSGKTELYSQVMHELDEYKKDPRRNSLVALYAYGIMELLVPSLWDVSISIKGLLKRPKYKDMYAIGQAFQAILDNDQASFKSSLIDLLKAHDGMVKHGSLRETAEGLICMPAMSLTYVALRRNITVDIENEYLSIEYLEFLLDNLLKNHLSA